MSKFKRTMIIKFDFEGRDEEAAFFALYAGLRMYKEKKDRQVKLLNAANGNSEEQFSIPAAEAFCMLQDLKEKFPKEYAEASEEYEAVYGTSNNQ